MYLEGDYSFVLKTDDSAIPAKVWLVPSGQVNCIGHMITSWANMGTWLWEEN